MYGPGRRGGEETADSCQARMAEQDTARVRQVARSTRRGLLHVGGLEVSGSMSPWSYKEQRGWRLSVWSQVTVCSQHS